MKKQDKLLVCEFEGTQAESLVKMVVAARDGVKVKKARKKSGIPKSQPLSKIYFYDPKDSGVYTTEKVQMYSKTYTDLKTLFIELVLERHGTNHPLTGRLKFKDKWLRCELLLGPKPRESLTIDDFDDIGLFVNEEEFHAHA